jgi:hypothetical protein
MIKMVPQLEEKVVEDVVKALKEGKIEIVSCNREADHCGIAYRPYSVTTEVTANVLLENMDVKLILTQTKR